MNRKLLLFLALVVLLIGVGIWVGTSFRSASADLSPYSAVYFETGDVYFGKLSWFPHPMLTGVWFLQRSVDAQNQPRVDVVPFTSAFWGPTDALYLNSKKVIFWARLRAESDIARALANPSLIQSGKLAPPPGAPAGLEP